MIYRGGRMVTKGLYWSIIDGTTVEMNGDAMLPGARKVIYMRRPPGGAYLAVPVIILLVVLTLPLTSMLGYLLAMLAPLVIVVAGVFYVCGKLVYHAYMSASEGWEPLKAYFTGNRKKRK
jgi:hypothetical protein